MKALGFTGDSGAGKTTLMERLIARFAAGGLRLAAIKHAHHGFDMDLPGKDSYRFRAAGAAQVLVASEKRWALLADEAPADLAQLPVGGALARQLARLDPCDLVLVEGYRQQSGIPFIDVRRAASAAAAKARPPAPGLIAIAADFTVPPLANAGALPVLDLNDIEAIARFVARTLELPPC